MKMMKSVKLSKEERASREGIELPVPERYCTDKICLIILLLSWFAMTLIGLCTMGYIKSPYLGEGNPELLLRGVDYMGNICGYDDPVKELQYKVMPNFLGTTPNNNGELVPILFSVCVSKCPSKGDGILDPYGTYGSWLAAADTSNVLNNCLYMNIDNVDNTSGTTVMSDFIRSYRFMAPFGLVLSIVCCLLFLFLIRIPLVLRTIVWFCVGLVFFISAFGSYVLLNKSHNVLDENHDAGYDQNKTEVTLLKFTGSVLVCFAVFWIVFVCYMRQRIALAISLIRESSHALVSMPLLCFLPLLQSGLFTAFTAIWLLYSVYLISSGDITTNTDPTTGFSYKTVTYSNNSKQAILFMVFVWFWSVGFLEALGQIVVSHVVLVWYFAADRSAITSAQVARSAVTSTLYHSGTAAFGSMMIALLRTLRMVLEYIKMKMTAMSADSNTRRIPCCNATCLVRYVCCCLGCLLWLFEKCIKFLNKHAYIQTAMFGTPFLVSAKRAYFMIMRNLGRMAAISVIGDFVVLIGKISITLTCSGLAYIYLSTYQYNEMNSVLLPCVFIAFIAFTTSTLFLGTLSAVVDSMLQATLVDEELQLGSSEINHKGLRELVIAHQQQWQELNTEEEFYASAVELADADEDEDSSDEDVEVELRVNRNAAMQSIFKQRKRLKNGRRVRGRGGSGGGGSVNSNESVDSESGEASNMLRDRQGTGGRGGGGAVVHNVLTGKSTAREVEMGVFAAKKATGRPPVPVEKPTRVFGGSKYKGTKTSPPLSEKSKNPFDGDDVRAGGGGGNVTTRSTNPFDEDYV